MDETREYLLEVREQRDGPTAESTFSSRDRAEAAYHRAFHELSSNPETLLDFSLRLVEDGSTEILSIGPQQRSFVLIRAQAAKEKNLLDSYLERSRAQNSHSENS